jgi:hypothetical protein
MRRLVGSVAVVAENDAELLLDTPLQGFASLSSLRRVHSTARSTMSIVSSI